MTIASAPQGRNAPDREEADGLLTPRQAADYLSISIRSLQTRTAAGEIPAVRMRRPGTTRGPLRYRRSDLDAYVASCMDQPVNRRGTS
jgi:excisionase family DNA binding protein